ncbi:MAG: SDR family NAD(P)-dependent oxidoreductase [Planctomycetota bacterium]|nr:SDR family NAD(P)-dependent oxidoreductase [Planctomycetota bacterium]
MKSTKHYLVTGGTGFIGSALVRALIQEGQKVRVLDNNSRGRRARLSDLDGQFQFIEADIRDAEAVAEACKGVDSVIHLAYVNGTEFFYKHPELILDIGIRGMLNVIDGCRAHGIRELVVASSSEVYQMPPSIPTTEDVPMIVPDPLNPRYSYGGGKILWELMALNYGRTGFDRVMIFRPHNVYGPDMGWEHVLPQFAMRVKAAIAENPTGPLPFKIQGDGSETRAFVHIDDFTAGLLKIIDNGEHLNIYNIGNDEEVTIKHLLDLVFKEVQRDYSLETSELTKGSTPRRCPDISKLRGLGFQPAIPIAEGMKSIVDWYLANDRPD